MGCCCSCDSTCPKCKGEGQIVKDYRSVTCSTCKGSGKINVDIDCKTCSGSGHARCTKCNGKRSIYKCDRCNGERIETCDKCQGIGTNKNTKKFYNKTKQCTQCNGSGIPPCTICNGTGKVPQPQTCSKCSGDKRIKIPILQKCANCKGKGVIETETEPITKNNENNENNDEK